MCLHSYTDSLRQLKEMESEEHQMEMKKQGAVSAALQTEVKLLFFMREIENSFLFKMQNIFSFIAAKILVPRNDFR